MSNENKSTERMVMHVLRILGRATRLFCALVIFGVATFFAVKWEISLSKYSFSSYLPVEEKVELWMPEKFTLANKSADGSYVKIDSITATNAIIPIEAYKLFSETGENTVVVLKNAWVNYFVKIRGITFHSAVSHKLASELPHARLDSVELIKDNQVVLRGSRNEGSSFRDFLLGTLGCTIIFIFGWSTAKKVLPPELFSEKAWFSRKVLEA